MNKSRLIGALCAVMLSLISASANASLVFLINTYTTDEVSFSISGTFDADTIGIFPGYLAVKNDWSNNIGVHTEWFSGTPAITVNSILIGGLPPSLTQAQDNSSNAWNDDVFFINAVNNTVPFTAGTTVSGSITLSGVGLFNPADLATLELVSGLNFTSPSDGNDDWARLEASAQSVIPLPAAVWLFGSALGVMGVMRRKISC
ncbi:MAG: VPLPA-CTERM sorting domain-containing protein [Chromatiales bacterium]|nr:MAG: VPLPA-CTERM sorting domain-containing protein [Chromatiales bacterium]